MIKLANLLTEDTDGHVPFMHSPIGFSCKMCKFLNFNKDESRYTCASTDYQEWAGTHFLVDENKKPITDVAHWCSDWFEPKGK